MKKTGVFQVVMLLVAVGFFAHPTEVAAGGLRLGGAGYLGMATAVGDFDDEMEEEYDEGAKPRFTGGGALLVDFFFTDMIGIGSGVGFLGQGWRIEIEGAEAKTKLLYLQIPLCLKLDIFGLVLGAGIGFDFALKGKTVAEYEGQEESEDWDDDMWDYHRRFNIAAKAMVGYAIELGPIFLVPSVDFSIHLLNNAQGDGVDETERHLNLLFGVAVLFGL